MRNDFLNFPTSATVGEVLEAYVDRQANYWWLLISGKADEYFVCSFGSLLPYLTGRTDHIVHDIGHCTICSGMDTLLWQDTGLLVEEALADKGICGRLLAELPMAALRTTAVTLYHKDGRITGIDYPQMKGDLGGPPSF